MIGRLKPFSAAECLLFDRSASSALGMPELFRDPAVQQALLQMAARGPLGRFMLRRLARRVRWTLRKGIAARDAAQAWEVARFLLLAAGGSVWPKTVLRAG